MANIYELTGAYKILENAIALNPDEEELKEELAKINDDIEVKADNYAKIIKNIEGDVNAIDAELKRLNSAKASKMNTVKRLKENLMVAMVETGKTKFKTKLFGFGVQKNGGKAPIELTVTPEELPEELRRVRYEADSDAIRKYIEETGDISYAVIKERGVHLSIR